MKKVFLILLCFAGLITLAGCKKEVSYDDPVHFYYVSAEPSYEVQSTAIQSEVREGNALATLEDAFMLYLQGPKSDELRNPFPAGLKLVSSETEGDTLILTFSWHLSKLSGLDLTIACCCIARTCLDFTDVKNVTIQASDSLLGGARSLTFNAENMLLLDQAQQPKSE